MPQPVSGFERFWNSTFGIPQQLLFRLLRAAQDDEVGLFDEAGLLDASLIPVFGMLDSRREDVRADEMVERINTLSGTDFDEDSFAAQLGVGIFTDPLTYMTGGATAAARSARIVRRATKVDKVRERLRASGLTDEALEAGAPAGFRADELGAHLDDILKKDNLSRRERATLEKAKREADAAGDADVANILARGAEHELRLGLPVFHRYGAHIWKTDQEKYWTSLLAKKATVPAALTQGLQQIPYVRAATRTISDALSSFGAGRRTGLDPLQNFERVTSPGELASIAAQKLTPERNTVRDLLRGRDRGKLIADFDDMVGEGMDPREALVRIMRAGSRDPRKLRVAKPEAAAEGYWRALNLAQDTGPLPEITSEGVQAVLSNFTRTYDRAAARFRATTGRKVFSEAGKARAGAASKRAFDVGRKWRRALASAFKTDAKAAELVEAGRELKTLTARQTEQLRALAEQAGPLMAEDARGLGMDLEDAKKFLLHLMEGTPLDDEIMSLGKRLDGAYSQHDVQEFGGALLNFSQRLQKVVDSMLVQVRRGKADPRVRAAVEQAAQALDTPSLRATRAVFGKPTKVKFPVGPPLKSAIGGIDANRHRLRTGPRKGRFLAHLTNDEVRDEVARLRGARNREVLESEGAIDLERVTKVDDDRLFRGGKVQRPKRAQASLPEDPRIPDRVVGLSEADEVKLDGFGLAVARLMQTGGELRRAASTRVVSPALIEDVATQLRTVQREFEGRILDAMGKHSRAYKFMRQARSKIASEAARSGLIGPSSPIAYVGRILAPRSTDAITRILQSEDVGRVLDAEMPQLSSSFGRNADAMTIEELNELHQALRKTGDPRLDEFVEEIEQIAADENLTLGKYETDPLTLTLNRLAQSTQRDTTTQFIADALDSAFQAKSAIAGRVTAVVTDAGEKVTLQELQRARVRRGARVTDVLLDDDPIREGVSGVVVATDAGEVTVPRAHLQDGFIGAKLGRSRIAREAGEELSVSEEVANAFSVRASKGQMDQHLFGKRPLTNNDLLELMDEQVIIGDETVVTGMFSALKKEWARSAPLMLAFDAAQHTVKRWQTVLRLPFHVLNAASVVPQGMAVGARPKHILAGMGDAMRMLYNDPAALRTYERQTLYALDEGQGLTGWIRRKIPGVPNQELVRVARRMGLENLDEADAAEMARVGLTPEDMQFRVGEQVISMDEYLNAVVEEGLFSTFISEGLRGASRTSDTLFRLRAAALDPKSVKGKWRRFLGGLETATETTEIFARLSLVNAQLRAGHSLRHAVRNAKVATVPYEQLTSFERTWMKRFIPFYTFPRHYLPVAYRHFAQNPTSLARAAAVLRDQKVFREENGRVRLDLGKIGSLDVTRADPNLEAVKMLEAVGEAFLSAGGSIGGPGERALRQERLRGETQQPFTIGSLAEMGVALMDGNVDTSATKEAADAFWFMRILLQPDDPLGEVTPLTRTVQSGLLPISPDRPEHRRRLVRGRYNAMIRELERKAQVAPDHQTRARLRNEARLLTRIARDNENL